MAYFIMPKTNPETYTYSAFELLTILQNLKCLNYVYILFSIEYMYHHHHHCVPTTQFPLTLSCPLSLLNIILSNSS